MAKHRPLIDISTRPKSRTPSQIAYRRCHRCRGSGQAPCQSCNGSGKLHLGNDGNGVPKFGKCPGCFGVKTRRCTNCAGTGMLESGERPSSRVPSRQL